MKQELEQLMRTLVPEGYTRKEWIIYGIITPIVLTAVAIVANF